MKGAVRLTPERLLRRQASRRGDGAGRVLNAVADVLGGLAFAAALGLVMWAMLGAGNP